MAKNPQRVAAGKKGRRKGARGERAAAEYLRSLGFEAERNARNGISTDDLRVPGLPMVHIEVKYGVRGMDVQTASLRKAWEQANETRAQIYSDGPVDLLRMAKSPVVLWKPLGTAWRLTWMDSHGLSTTAGDAEIKAVLERLNGGE